MSRSHIDRSAEVTIAIAEEGWILDDEGKARLGELCPHIEGCTGPGWLEPGQCFLVPSGTLIIAGKGPKRIVHSEDESAPLGWPIIEGACIIGLYETIIGYSGKTGFCVPEFDTEIEPGPRVWYMAVPYSELGRLNDEVPCIRHWLRSFYEKVIEAEYLWSQELERGFEDYFLPDNAGLVPGPYEAADVKMTVFVMEERMGKLQALLPPHMHVVPFCASRYLLVFSSFRDLTTEHCIGEQKEFNYTETTLFVPAWAPLLCQTPAAFTPQLFLDNYLAILLGRELYGFPKRYGYTLGREVWQGFRTIVLYVEDKPQVVARWDGEEPMDDISFVRAMTEDMLGEGNLTSALGEVAGFCFEQLNKCGLVPDVPVVVRDQVPATAFPWETEPYYETDRLVRVPFNVYKYSDFARLENADLRFTGPILPVGGRCIDAYSFTLRNMEFGQAHVVHRYDPLCRKLGLAARGVGLQLLDLLRIGKRALDCCRGDE